MKSIIHLFLFAFSDFLQFHVVDHVKSSALTNADATPRVLNPAYLAGGRVRCHRGKCTTVTAAAEANTTMRFCRVRSNDMIKDIRLDHDGFGTGSTMHIGVYQTPDNGGAAVDADFFADSVDVAAAAKNVQVLNESAFNTLAKLEQPLWQALGLSADPKRDYDIVGTLAVAATKVGNAVLTVETVGGY